MQSADFRYSQYNEIVLNEQLLQSDRKDGFEYILYRCLQQRTNIIFIVLKCAFVSVCACVYVSLMRSNFCSIISHHPFHSFAINKKYFLYKPFVVCRFFFLFLNVCP